MRITNSLIVALIAIAPACERDTTDTTTPKPRRNQIDDQQPDSGPPTSDLPPANPSP